MGRSATGIRRVGAIALVTFALGAPAAHANSTPWQLANQGPYSQAWSGGAPANDDSWADIPSIEGFCGSGATTSDADPLTAQALGGQCLTVNRTDPAADGPSGISEFDGSWNTVALGANTIDGAPSLLLHMNTTGMTAIEVNVRFRDIDTSARDSTGQVSVQYQDTPGGPFKRAMYRADVSGDGFDVNGDVTLPPSADDNPNLKIRFVTTNSVGTDEWIGVDDIGVTGVAAPSAGAFRLDADDPLGLQQFVYMVDEEAGTANVRVMRNGGAAGPASVRFATFGLIGGAKPGLEFTPVDRVLEFAPGETSKDVPIPLFGDPLLQGRRRFGINLTLPTGGATISGGNSSMVWILDDERPSALLNEVDVDPDGVDADNRHEYVELRSEPGLRDFNSLSVVAVDGSSTGAGEVQWAQRLENPSVSGSGSGIAFVADDDIVPAHQLSDPFPATIGDAFLDTGAALSDGAVSFLLIDSPQPILAGQDLDTGSSGLDLPAGAELVDGIGWARPGIIPADRVYGANLSAGNAADRPWDAATRFPTDLRSVQADAWYHGQLKDETPDEPEGQGYDTTKRSPNFPAMNGALSPGGRNRHAVTTNEDPVAVGDAYTTTRDTVLMRGRAEGLLTGDTDPEGEIIGAAVLNQAAHGQAEVFPDGSFRYVPDAGYDGPDAFTYRASDGMNSDSAAVTVNVVPPPPAPSTGDPGPGAIPGAQGPGVPGGGGGGGGGGGSVLPDGIAPGVTGFAATNRTFAVDTRGRAETSVTAAAAKKGTTFRYTLSEPARVVFTIEQATTGRRVGSSCRKPSRSNRRRRKCTRYVLVGRFAQASTTGANRKAFSGRIGRKRMKPGKHRASLVASDAAGNKSAAKRLNLRVVRR